ncbi:MAG TPA: ATP-binding protein, partial [Rhodopila sp.]|nr:ATP-binding protein [Rhodopila sp.]
MASAILMTWGFLLLDLRQEYRDTLSGALRETRGAALGLGETTLVSFDAIDQSLKALRMDYARDPATFDLKAWLASHQVGTGLLIQAAIVDRNGIVVASNLPLRGRVDLSDREHIRVQRQSTTDEMFISQPVLGRVSKTKSLNITRKILAPDGSYAGAVVLSVGLDFLTRFYQSLTSEGYVFLVGAQDGVIRARAPADNAVIGTRDPGISAMIGSGGVGSVRSRATEGGADRIISFMVLDRYPLAVVAALDARAVFAQYYRDQQRAFMAGVVLTVMFLGIGLQLLRQRRRLLASQSTLTATLENISQGIMMIEADGSVPVINRRAVELLQLPQSLMVRNPTFQDILTYQLATNEFGPAAEIDSEFISFIQRGGLSEKFGAYERARPDGTALEVRTKMLGDGRAVRTFTDITARKRSEEALAAARDAAEAGSRARSEFIAVMSHEIRTPMNGILGLAELLTGMPLSPAAAEHVRLIEASGRHLMQIINDILDFSRLGAGRLDLDVGEFDLRELMSQTVALVAQQARAKGLALICDIADAVPSRVSGDAQRLRQIVLNLAGNSVKFTEKGHIRISVRRMREDAPYVRLAFAVTDSGIGIKADALGRLFTEFTQVDSSISRRFGGSGLGLAITRRLVEMMGGSISVESTLGVGSTFRFDIRLQLATDMPATRSPGTTLKFLPETEPAVSGIVPPAPTAATPDVPDLAEPAAAQSAATEAPAGTDPAAIESPAAAPAPAGAATTEPAAAPAEAADSGGWRILMAEDNATNQFVAARMIERLGHRLTCVDDGHRAVEA